jgi:hypothetical protein
VGKELPRLSGKSKLAEAIRYATSRRVALKRFLTHARIEIDSNIVERAIRPQTITKSSPSPAPTAAAGPGRRSRHSFKRQNTQGSPIPASRAMAETFAPAFLLQAAPSPPQSTGGDPEGDA